MPSQQEIIVQINFEEKKKTMFLKHDRFLFALSNTYGVVVGLSK